MQPYQINMVRDYVMPLPSRRKWLRWIGLYLVAMGVVIATVLWHLLCMVMDCSQQEAVLAIQERRLLATSPGFQKTDDLRQSLAREMAGVARDMELVETFAREEIPLGEVLLGLTAALPAGVELNRLEFDGSGRKLVYDVVMLADRKRPDNLTPPRLVSLWKQDPVLSSWVSAIEVETSERLKVDGVNMQCWRFSATLRGVL